MNESDITTIGWRKDKSGRQCHYYVRYSGKGAFLAVCGKVRLEFITPHYAYKPFCKDCQKIADERKKNNE